MNGKGSAKRPAAIPRGHVEAEYERIFGAWRRRTLDEIEREERELMEQAHYGPTEGGA